MLNKDTWNHVSVQTNELYLVEKCPQQTIRLQMIHVKTGFGIK